MGLQILPSPRSRDDNHYINQSVGQVAILVRDYDEALNFYVEVLGFKLIEDTPIHAQDKRWVVVAPAGSSSFRLLLARAVGEEQVSRIGNQTGGRVFLFLYTDDFWRDFRSYKARGLYSFGSRRRNLTGPSQSSRTFMEICGICCNSGHRTLNANALRLSTNSVFNPNPSVMSGGFRVAGPPICAQSPWGAH
jgi:catechol 2,3-dioxygenase-like lactoylglutathione lyase family enzyme